MKISSFPFSSAADNCIRVARLFIHYLSTHNAQFAFFPTLLCPTSAHMPMGMRATAQPTHKNPRPTHPTRCGSDNQTSSHLANPQPFVPFESRKYPQGQPPSFSFLLSHNPMLKSQNFTFRDHSTPLAVCSKIPQDISAESFNNFILLQICSMIKYTQ